MAKQTVVHKGRYAIKRVNLNEDLSGYSIANFISQIRARPEHTSELIVEWTVVFDNGTGSDGVLRLTLDDSVTGAITHTSGFMDVMRVDGGQKTSLFDEALPVEFRGMPSDE